MKRAIYPGSFDPLTLGHLDMIERSAKIVDELVIGVLNNSAKNSLFSLDERVSMIKEMTESMPNVTVASFDGLLVDYMKEINATIIVRGLRAVRILNMSFRLHRRIMWRIRKWRRFFSRRACSIPI